MNKNSKQLFVSLALIACGFGLIFVLSNYIAAARPPLPAEYEDEDLALKGARLKGFALGFDGLIADWYWMQSLQYIGGKIEKSEQQFINIEDLTAMNPRLLYPLLDNATTLDPQFLAAYSYGAVVLPAIDPAQAIKFTEKGIRDNPTVWRLYHHLGYIHWRLKDYEKASEVYAEGGRIAGAPDFMRLMAAQMKTRGGSRETARVMYRQMFDEAQDKQTRENAALRLLELDSLDERDAIRGALDNFRAKNNRCPANWREVFPLLRGQKTAAGANLRFEAATAAPVDPTNVPYVLRSENGCEAAIDDKTSKIPSRQP
jgi:tetratricopeptide (TPR) repeat protein